MRKLCQFAVLVAVGLLPAAADAAGIEVVGFLTGHWRGTLANGRVAEEICTTAEGGVLLSTGREFAEGRCVFFDLVLFAEKDGTVILTPHPLGRKSEHEFPLLASDRAANRVVFENKSHDFPQRFTYELIAVDRLRITLEGEVKGKPAREVYDLSRVP